VNTGKSTVRTIAAGAATVDLVLNLTNPVAGDRAVILAQPADAAGLPIPGAAAGDALTLTVGA
jgi:hypothetical protein